MPGVARVGLDAAGGTIVGNLAPTVFVNGCPVAVQGAQVASHGRSPHDAPVMSGHSTSVFAHGIPVCRQGDAATCGHAASGSGNVFAG
ncbi:MAG: PAAR domain-containing protein [Candidatus Accumulibacter sp.]|jgi:uncharacterized Zn-binding protein involved in type VI secretion|nr:PAAR domain-containing protein [Accumulibacter sp.]